MSIHFDLASQLLPGLPPFEGGRMADSIYDAGRGRFARYNDNEPISFEMNISPKDITKALAYFQLAGCEIQIRENTDSYTHLLIAYEGASYEIIKKQNHIRILPGHANAALPQEDPCLERAVTQTNAQAFEAYLCQLEKLGYTRIFENRLENNLFAQLKKDGSLLCASYMGNTHVARFVTDSVSVPITAMSGGEALPGEKAQLCQFGLFYDRMVPGTSANCGMLYILKLPDRSLFLIDGGEYEQATDAAVNEVLRIMRNLSGTASGGKIPVAGWFCTHAHDDHMDLMAKLIRFHHDEIDLKRIIFNFPAFSQYPLMPSTYIMLARLNRYYPDALYLKPHAGQAFCVAGTRFLFLQTHEDSICALGNEKSNDFNDTSTVLKIFFDDVSFMVLGDINENAERVLVSHYGPETLHATAVQTAHHLINLLPYVYPAIAPAIALVPGHIKKAEPSNEKYLELLKSVPKENVFFASSGSGIWTAQNEKLALTKLYPVVGSFFDQSAI